MEGGRDSKTTRTKRRFMSTTSSSGDDIDDHHSKRSKTSNLSSSEAVATRSSLSSSSSEVTNIDDLPDNLLVDIICRLPSSKFAFQCKCVCKRWDALISDPCFIGRFLRIQRDHMKIPVKSTLISSTGEEYLNRISCSTTKPFSLLFNKLMTAYGLEQEPVVVGTYNDLILCCATYEIQRDYYICNPYTTQYVALPPPPQVHEVVAVGFMCDLPYYSTKKDDEEGYGIQLNDGFRCRVLRLVMGDKEVLAANFKVEIYASETNQWIETVVSAPSVYGEECGYIDFFRSIAYNGMLYWEGGTLDASRTFLIGLDPFKIENNNTSTSDDDVYKCRFIQFEGRESPILSCSGVAGRCLRMCLFKSVGLCVWDLNEEDDQVGRLAIHGGDVKIDLQKTMRVYTLDGTKLLPGSRQLLGSNLCNEDILYLVVGRNIIEYNIATNEWSVLNVLGDDGGVRNYYPIVLPQWPTPVPKPLRATYIDP